MSKTLLFGGSGFLGDVFLRENPDFISIGRTSPMDDIKNKHIQIESMDDLSLLDGEEFDKVIFLIGNSNHHMLNNSNMAGIEYNVIPLKQALHYFQKRNLKKFVCFTSILLYGNESKGRPVNEKDIIYPYQNEYIFSKFLAEQIVEFYKSRIPIINIRLSNIYGSTSLLRPDLVPTLMLDCLTKENPTIWNDTPRRDFIFASDAADAIIKLMRTEFTGNINLGSGKSHTVSELARIIEKLSGKKITSLNKEVTGVMDFTADISLLKQYIDWEPKHTLEEGLIKTFNVMKNKIN
jgi:nucleoside-diphosphate-sugar epimerase